MLVAEVAEHQMVHVDQSSNTKKGLATSFLHFCESKYISVPALVPNIGLASVWFLQLSQLQLDRGRGFDSSKSILKGAMHNRYRSFEINGT